MRGAWATSADALVLPRRMRIAVPVPQDVKGKTRMGIILSLVVVLVPLLVLVIVLASLGWLGPAVLASVGLIGQGLLRLTRWVVRHT